MKVNEFKELIDYIEQSSIDVLKLENKELKLYFQKHNAANVTIDLAEQAAPAAQMAPKDETIVELEQPASNEDNSFHQIESPMVGTFYSRSNPDAEPFVQVGSMIEKNQPVCVLEAMKLFNEVASDVDGEIIEILAEDGQIIEFGQPLFVVKVSD
ncbi:acetyl-CoA carboxylase biotin carboxyl carrier protein [Bacillus aerolatus]|uniref:Biotin carboxyl carrier protein of acetyl-CoA carboxylase n=1 Tax=Bacillus aerolatus TaxID=2653354 RepID=A0A6I1FJF7_9BACI|nr:acetyl-CoA carboxylase biotin carboxyl carrier protein [Bacillus aerolatus]KAB7706534.1 acetyl-CoA carboxylase biotin carboxyl carrier protein [Bacillus aerolatus]